MLESSGGIFGNGYDDVLLGLGFEMLLKSWHERGY